MLVEQEQRNTDTDDPLSMTKTLICALNYVSRNLPIPPHVYDVVSSIYNGGAGSDESETPDKGPDDNEVPVQNDLMSGFEEALLKQRSRCISGSGLLESRENRYQSQIQHRMSELEGLPSTRGDDLQTKCLLELYGLKLKELQSKVRSDVSAEHWLRTNCANPNNLLFDWGMMRLHRPMYGVGDPFGMESDDLSRKKRDAERLSRIEEEERNHVETRKNKFFADLLNAVREFQLQIQASQKRRKQRNDGVQSWHGRQRQRATRAEKLRFQALKADDQEAYMKLVKESKNERLTMLLEETNKLLVNLGAAVQRQKDAKYSDGIEELKGSESDLSELEAPKSETPQDLVPDKDVETVDSDNNDDSNDLLEGQRQYNSAIHAIQEKVSEQPSLLQGGELRSYQVEGLQWMVSLFNNNLNGILADEMGLGKTIQTISLIAYLKENKHVDGPHLIVAPKAVLPNWVNEFATWAPSITAILYDGRLDERKAIREQISGEGKFCVLITHYDLIMRDKSFLKKIDWFYMIVDEGHRLKNHECALAKTLLSGYRIQRRLLLTGTPIQNSLQELWSLLNFLLPHIFNSVAHFGDWFNAPFADRGDVSLTAEEELLIIHRLHHVIRPFILRRKKNEVEKFLPGKTQVILKCDMSSWQKAYYHQVTDVGRVGMNSGSGKSKSLQNLSMQLRKCCNHPYLFVGRDYNMWQKAEIVRSSGKFELLDRLLPKLHRAGHRILLFSQMTRLMDVLGIYLTLNDYKFLRLDGSTNTEQRGTLLKQFNDPNSPYFIFLLSTRAGGLGLNLQTADTVVIFDSDWNPQMDQQAEDRAHRIGQKKEVRVFVLVSVGSIEEVILERAKQKMGIDAKVIQAGLFNTTSTAQDRREMLEEIMRRGTSSLGKDVPSEREINRLAARTEEEFWMFEKMDEERRQKEKYRSRLLEEHEVPEWVYATPTEEEKAKALENDSNGGVLGKRRRKEVVYSDSLSDLQWIKAVEKGEDVSLPFFRERRRDNDGNELASKTSASASASISNNNTTMEKKVLSGNFNSGVEKKVVRLNDESFPSVSEGTSEDTFSSAPKRHRSSSSKGITIKALNQGDRDMGMLSWNIHKKKRSSYTAHQSSSSDSRGHNHNGRGN